MGASPFWTVGPPLAGAPSRDARDSCDGVPASGSPARTHVAEVAVAIFRCAARRHGGKRRPYG
ncbi:MAG: hypothetical protein RLZZ15_2418 [Verrucomicrobiota bacterium]